MFVQRAYVRGRAGDAVGRVADLAKAVDAGADGAAVAELADVRAAEGKWSEAVRLFSLAAERGSPRRHFQALACLKAGDREGYRRVCDACLNQTAADQVSPAQANGAAWVCVLAPDAMADYERAVTLAERAVSNGSREEQTGYLNTLGAILCRAGRHRDAVARLREGMKLAKYASAEDWSFMGLAYHSLGDVAEAKRCLEQFRAAPQPPAGTFSWARVEYDLLREQLETALATSLKN